MKPNNVIYVDFREKLQFPVEDLLDWYEGELVAFNEEEERRYSNFNNGMTKVKKLLAWVMRLLSCRGTSSIKHACEIDPLYSRCPK